MMWLLIILATEEAGFWETATGEQIADVLRALVGVGIVAAAWKGLRYLVSEVLGIKGWVSVRRQEAQRREALMDEMLSPEGWPRLVTEVHELRLAIENMMPTDDKE